ncbi:MAG: hypothetical protein JHD16_17570 [Solirubrobacteraceae bacterium]|nr:hypothetical protein [Solirubrobacteraceae bacterium]
MARADSGGFDLVFELSIAAIRQRLAPAIGAPLPDTNLPVEGWGTLVLDTQFSLTDLTLLADATVRAEVGASITLSWPALVFGGIQLAPAGSQVFGASVSVAGQPAASGTSLSLEFGPTAVQVEITPGTLEGVLGIGAYLTAVGQLFGDAAREAERERIYENTEQALEGSLNAGLPAAMPLGTLPQPPVSSVEFAATGQELRVLMMIGGRRADANPAAITRSAIRLGPGGIPRDVAAVILGNGCLLRDILRPVLRDGLNLTNAGFVASHPCAWAGSVALPESATVAGVRPRVRAVVSGLDAAGQLHVRLAFDGEHSTGAFGIEGQLDLSFAISIAENSDGTRTLTLSVGTGVVSQLDIWIAWWVYAGGILVSPLLVLALILIDAFAGGGLANTINGAVRGALGNGTLDLPLPDTPFGVATLSSSQADSAVQSVTVGPFTVSDLRANDVIVRIG